MVMRPYDPYRDYMPQECVPLNFTVLMEKKFISVTGNARFLVYFQLILVSSGNVISIDIPADFSARMLQC
jgi:hypothetical protein